MTPLFAAENPLGEFVAIILIGVLLFLIVAVVSAVRAGVLCLVRYFTDTPESKRERTKAELRVQLAEATTLKLSLETRRESELAALDRQIAEAGKRIAELTAELEKAQAK